MSDILDLLSDLRIVLHSGKLVKDKRKPRKSTKHSLICLKQKQTISPPKQYMAYDLETSRIKSGTPTLKYITVFGKENDVDYKLSMPIKGKNKYETLCNILETHLLTPERNRMRYIAWNGNNYDAFFIAKSLLLSDKWIIKPYLTRTKSLRGFKVMEKEIHPDRFRKLSFEFLDGLSMTGLSGTKIAKLKEFLEVYAPDFGKLKTVDFSKEEFDYKKPSHVDYAERDSEGLFYGLQKVNIILKDLTGNELQPTIGNLAIKYFQSRIPEDVEVWRPPEALQNILYRQLKKGGYCWAQKQYHGPVWKYDLNQAYAAAMRDAKLPQGNCSRISKYEKNKSAVYCVKMSRAVLSQIPFYYRTLDKNLGFFTTGAECETWLTSSEYEHLISDNWQIEITDGYLWETDFNMSAMVHDLEKLRGTDPQGPNGPLGTMVKMIGNNAYGKTLEQLEGLDLIFANEAPEGFISYMPEDLAMAQVFCKFNEPLKRAYHQPQIGAFITAHVRILVREAALQNADAFLYADTDCVVFSNDKAKYYLDIDSKRYGAWKQEDEGFDYIFIGKKMYYKTDGSVKKAKGLNVKDLTKQDYENWLHGIVPVQDQVQRQNFVKFMGGKAMFSNLKRKGTNVKQSKQARLVGSLFEAIAG